MAVKRVSQAVLRKRRITLVVVLSIIILIGIIFILFSCKDDKDTATKKPMDSMTLTSTTTGTTNISDTALSTTIVVVTDNLGQTVTNEIGEVLTSVIINTNISNSNDNQTITTTVDIGPDPSDGSRVQSIELTFYTCELDIGEVKMPYVTMLPDTADLTEEWTSSDESIATVDWLGNITAVSPGTCFITVKSVNNPNVSAQVKVTVKGEDNTKSTDSANTNLSITPETVSEPSYFQGILIANKSYPLPADYNPGFDPTTSAKFDELASAAANENLNIYLSSGFRSYSDQERIYNNYIASYGQATADTFSARPGHSEHQSGLALDVNTIDDSFAGTPEAIWLENHAHEYGFIIRYPKGKEEITGYKYEPWHLRYLGVDTATAVYNSGMTLEEYLGIYSTYAD